MKISKLLATATVVILAAGCNNNKNMETEVPEISAFHTGKPNVAYEQYFSGRSWLAPLTSMKELNVPVSNVTFEPGCRNNWHSHTGGQLLVCVGGEGYYQEKGKPARRLKAGDLCSLRRLFRIFLSGTLFIKSGEFHPCSGLQQQRVRQCDPEERR